MTVLDTSVPHYPVLMVLGGHEPVGEVPMAEGYSLRPYDPSYKLPWVELHVELGQLPSVEEGLSYFERTYESDPDALRERMLLACDERGELAGTSSVWRGDHFGEPRLRVHWVGVSPRHQRRGLAKSLMLHTIRLYDELAARGEAGGADGHAPLYLTTQTESYVAVSMYRKLGFTAYRGPMPPAFGACADTFAEDNERAWDIIDDKIAEMGR